MTLPEWPKLEEKGEWIICSYLLTVIGNRARRAQVHVSSCEAEKGPGDPASVFVRREGVERPNEIHLFHRV